MIKMIFACGPKGEFGKDDGLPWNVSGDLEHFKAYTRGMILIMSSATFASLPCKLPGRVHYVLGRPETVAKNGDEPDYLITENGSLEALCESLFRNRDVGTGICIIGGRELLADAAEICDAASVTKIDGKVIDGATHFIDDEYIIDRLNSRLRFNGVTSKGDNHTVMEWVL